MYLETGFLDEWHCYHDYLILGSHLDSAHPMTNCPHGSAYLQFPVDNSPDIRTEWGAHVPAPRIPLPSSPNIEWGTVKNVWPPETATAWPAPDYKVSINNHIEDMGNMASHSPSPIIPPHIPFRTRSASKDPLSHTQDRRPRGFCTCYPGSMSNVIANVSKANLRLNRQTIKMLCYCKCQIYQPQLWYQSRIVLTTLYQVIHPPVPLIMITPMSYLAMYEEHSDDESNTPPYKESPQNFAPNPLQAALTQWANWSYDMEQNFNIPQVL
ncbi:hypothetical protein B0H34DRAFT_800782 [Crassisporium funariophilum]|nr:hypothetical protein B0H34DRAFT_800782 [Crassisporium funariophilum]